MKNRNQAMRLLSFDMAIGLFGVLILPLWAYAASPIDGTVQVQSDKLVIDHDKHSAKFDGNVRAIYRDLELKCSGMTVFYDGVGEIVELYAKGRVQVKNKDATANADSARLDAKLGLLVLEGNPSLVRGLSRLEGSRIEILLSSEKIDIVNAKGTFEFSKGNK